MRVCVCVHVRHFGFCLAPLLWSAFRYCNFRLPCVCAVAESVGNGVRGGLERGYGGVEQSEPRFAGGFQCELHASPGAHVARIDGVAHNAYSLHCITGKCKDKNKHWRESR